MGDVRSVSVSGNFVASNSAQIVPLLAAPGERRAFRLLSVNYTVMDAQGNNDRLMAALHLGDFVPGSQTIETGGWRVILGADPLQNSAFVRTFAHAAFGGGTGGAQAAGSHQVMLHDLEVYEDVQVIVFLPDNTTDLAWVVDILYEQIKVSEREWSRGRHRPPVETRTIGPVTV